MIVPPSALTPKNVGRAQLVSDLMDSLGALQELPTEQQLAKLEQAQRLLHAVLMNDVDAAQLGLPGLE